MRNYDPTKTPSENNRLTLADQAASGATASGYQWPATQEEIIARTLSNANQMVQDAQSTASYAIPLSEKGAAGGVALDDLSNAGAQAALRRSEWVAAIPPIPRRRVMADPPTLSVDTSSQISGSIRWSPSTTSTAVNTLTPASEFFAYTRGAKDNAQSNTLIYNNVTTTSGGTRAGISMGIQFFHTGLEFEVGWGPSGNSFLIKVDDEYVSLTPTSIAGSGGQQYHKVTFASSARRRIELITKVGVFYGIYTAPTDTVEAAPARGPRCIVVGDSFGEQWPNGFITAMGDALGWDDMWGSALGGTGYLNTQSGTKKTFRERLATDVIPYAPEVVITVGSPNDSSLGSVAAEAALYYEELRAGCPDAIIIGAINYTRGVQSVASTGLDYRDAIKAAVEAVGGHFIDLMERPISPPGTALQVTSLKNNYSAGQSGATGIHVAAPVKQQGTYEIGTGATRERILVRTSPQVNGTTWNATFDGTLRYAHSTAEPFVQVGGSLWTGAGYVGAETGVGNCDLLVSADGIHPTALGHEVMGLYLGAQISAILSP